MHDRNVIRKLRKIKVNLRLGFVIVVCCLQVVNHLLCLNTKFHIFTFAYWT